MAREKPTNYSGWIWTQTPQKRQRTVSIVCKKLSAHYGKSNLDNPSDPLDDLVFIILSNKTTPNFSKQVYESIKLQFPRWEDLMTAGAVTLEKMIRPAGLSMIKSKHIINSLSKIYMDFGDCSLSNLGNLSTQQAEDYLTSLPGVSEKVAKCILLFTLGRKVLPVDTHVHRITRRLGWTARKRADQSHAELEELIPEKYRYDFHVDCILHGRKICRPQNPACSDCVVKQYCHFFINNHLI